MARLFIGLNFLVLAAVFFVLQKRVGDYSNEFWRNKKKPLMPAADLARIIMFAGIISFLTGAIVSGALIIDIAR